LDFLADAKTDQLPICGQPLADTFHAFFQTVPLQIVFPLFPRSTQILKVVAIGLLIRVFLG
jgi:hypothetical protein